MHISAQWAIFALGFAVQFVLSIRFFYRRARANEMNRLFVKAMVLNHLPHIQKSLWLIASHLGIQLPPEPPVIDWSELDKS